MTVYFESDTGPVSVEVDEYGITFWTGTAAFADKSGKEYRIPIGCIWSIEQN